VSGFNLTFTSVNVSQNTYHKAIGRFHTSIPQIVDRGAVVIWYFTNTSFSISLLTAPNISSSELGSLLGPWLTSLKQSGIWYASVLKQYTSFLEQYQVQQGAIPVGTQQFRSWVIPRSFVQNNNDNLTAAYRNITEGGASVIVVGLNVSQTLHRHGAGGVDEAVLLAWRDALIDTSIIT